ncbi:DUF1702 family protein [Actinomycetospora atypica]|uniref:DUF1702 family protein n=1 Tax=Actinomycetospora atypica TaxID=1290095 RepID=A0ABV9YMV5_9PSEU
MTTVIGRLRRRLLAPTEADVRFASRGFPVVGTPAVRALERVPAAVVRGFRSGIDGSPLEEVATRATAEAPDLRGFHHEGAVMAACVVDAMDPRGRGRARALLTGPARAHVLLGWIGVGFALAKLPRPVWSRAVPDLDDLDHQAVMSWLAVDGYAFDLAFFDHRRWLDRAGRVPAFAWRGDSAGVPHVIDQGFGRALWFVHGADVDAVGIAVNRFGAHRRADLWAGVGLAATLAGGAGAEDLRRLARTGDAGELGLGAVFAATAATAAATDTGMVPDHVATGVHALSGLPVADAVAVGEATAPRPDETDPGEYLRWRARIRRRLAVTSPVLRSA